MLEILQFIFSNFWIWFGATIMLGIAFGGPHRLITIIRKNNKENE